MDLILVGTIEPKSFFSQVRFILRLIPVSHASTNLIYIINIYITLSCLSIYSSVYPKLSSKFRLHHL